MEHHVWDTCRYHDHPCIVECEWNTDTLVTHEHWLVLHPTDGTRGSYIVTEDQLVVDQLQGNDSVNSLRQATTTTT